MVLRDDLYRDVKAALAIRCGIDETRITEDADLYEYLGMDSLDFLGIAQVLQNRYTVLLDNESVAGIRTVGILTFFEKQIAARQAASVSGTAQRLGESASWRTRSQAGPGGHSARAHRHWAGHRRREPGPGRARGG